MPKTFVIVNHAFPEDWLKLITFKCDQIIGQEESKGFSQDLKAQLDEADGLFRPRGSTQAINSALKSYTELNKEIRDRSLSSRVWDEYRRALARTTMDLEKIQSELADNRVEINRLQRIQRVLPKLARRLNLLQELESLSDVVILPDDFTVRRQQFVQKLEMAQAIVLTLKRKKKLPKNLK